MRPLLTASSMAVLYRMNDHRVTAKLSPYSLPFHKLYICKGYRMVYARGSRKWPDLEISEVLVGVSSLVFG